MAESVTPSKLSLENAIWRYSSIAIFLADLLLILSLAGVRASRARLENVPFITPTFALILVGAIILAGASWLFTRSHIFKNRVLASPALAGVWLIISFAGLILIREFVPGIERYFPSFMLWLLIVNIGLLPALFRPALSRLNVSSLLQSVAVLLLSITIPLAILEVAMRFWFTTFGTENDRVAYIYSLEDILAQRNRFQGAPYINYGLTPNHPDHNSRGYRGDELSQDETFRIFTVGGSTTYGVSLPNEATYPATLKNLLQVDFPQVEVVNAGVQAYASPDTLANFTYRILDDKPDMLIIYHAVNDVVIRLVDPAQYNGANPARGIWQNNAQVSSSALYRFVTINLGLTKSPGYLDSLLRTDTQTCSDPAYCSEWDMTPQQLLDANPPIYFERNLRNLITLAQANDVQVVLSTWAYFPDAVNNFEYMTRPHMQSGVAEHNEIIRRIAAELDLPLIDLAETMPVDDTLWQDGLHMTPAGTLEQATQYAAFLAENNLIPETANP